MTAPLADHEKLKDLLSRSDVSLQTIAEEIKRNVSLSQLVLRHANSAAVGLKHQVERLDHAVAVLGARRLHFLIEQAPTLVAEPLVRRPHFALDHTTKSPNQ